MTCSSVGVGAFTNTALSNTLLSSLLALRKYLRQTMETVTIRPSGKNAESMWAIYPNMPLRGIHAMPCFPVKSLNRGLYFPIEVCGLSSIAFLSI